MKENHLISYGASMDHNTKTFFWRKVNDTENVYKKCLVKRIKPRMCK